MFIECCISGFLIRFILENKIRVKKKQTKNKLLTVTKKPQPQNHACSGMLNFVSGFYFVM